MSEGQESSTTTLKLPRAATPAPWPHGQRLGRPAPAAPAASGLDALRARGVRPRRLGLVEDFARREAGDPLVEAELLMGLLDERLARREPCGDVALALWRQVGRIDGAAVRDAAQRLVVVGLADPSALDVALAAVETLLAAEPQRPLWRAYAARLQFEVCACSRALELANDTLREPDLDAVSWALCIDTLRGCGAGATALRALHAAVSHPRLGVTAAALLRSWSLPRPLQPRVGPRLRRRPG